MVSSFFQNFELLEKIAAHAGLLEKSAGVGRRGAKSIHQALKEAKLPSKGRVLRGKPTKAKLSVA